MVEEDFPELESLREYYKKYSEWKNKTMVIFMNKTKIVEEIRIRLLSQTLVVNKCKKDTLEYFKEKIEQLNLYLEIFTLKVNEKDVDEIKKEAKDYKLGFKFDDEIKILDKMVDDAGELMDVTKSQKVEGDMIDSILESCLNHLISHKRMITFTKDHLKILKWKYEVTNILKLNNTTESQVKNLISEGKKLDLTSCQLYKSLGLFEKSHYFDPKDLKLSLKSVYKNQIPLENRRYDQEVKDLYAK